MVSSYTLSPGEQLVDGAVNHYPIDALVQWHLPQMTTSVLPAHSTTALAVTILFGAVVDEHIQEGRPESRFYLLVSYWKITYRWQGIQSSNPLHSP